MGGARRSDGEPGPNQVLILRRIQVLGSQQNGREYLCEALDYVANGKVKVIAETYALAEMKKAFERVAAGEVCYRAVVHRR